jgi:hypothetical protein
MPTLSLPEMGNIPRPTLVWPTLALPPASSQAEAAVLYFAATHLGVAPKLLYAGDLGSASGNAATVLTTVTGQLPAEVQAYITAMSNLSGAAYWGVWQIGSGIVGIGDCTDNPNCTVTMDSLKLSITSSSAGVYGLYTPGQATTSAEALALLLATFPALNGLSFEEFPTETGFAFQAIIYDLSQNASAKYVYAGALGSAGQAFVYALVAVGDGYVELAR